MTSHNSMIMVDIVAADSATMGTWRIIGTLPDGVHMNDDGYSLYVNVVDGFTIVSYSTTDEVLVKVRGFGKAMTALADRFNLPVHVQRDFGVRHGSKVEGVYDTTMNLSKAADRDAHLNEVEAQRTEEGAVFLAECDDDGTPLDGTDNLLCGQCDLSTRESWQPVKRFNKRKASLNGRSKWKAKR